MSLDPARLTPRGAVLPHFKATGEWRALGRIKTDAPKMMVAAFGDYLAAIEAPLLDLSQLPAYDRWQSAVPILDQGSNGSCVAHAHATAMMKARDLTGSTFLELSADSLYAQIDGGRDQGSDPADAITSLEQNGICLLSDVPDKYIHWNQIPAQAKQTALRFRIVPAGVYRCNNFAEMVTADWLGFAVTLCINVGGNFDPGPSGVVGYKGGQANHCVSGGEAFKLINGVPAYRFRNSWTTRWGIQGCAWCTPQHIDHQPGLEVYAIKWAIDDPLDPLNPPPLVA